MLYDAADYKEKAQMRKDYPDFNFKKIDISQSYEKKLY